MKILAIYASSRTGGNTEYLADRSLEGLAATRVYLREKHIESIIDQRHEPQGFSPVDDDYDELIEQVRGHEVLLFATPLYWYGVPGPLKNFFDRWSQTLREKRFDFRAEMSRKEAYVVMTGGEDAVIKGLPCIQQLNYIFDFVGTRFEGYIIGRGGKPGDVARDERSLSEAASLNRRLIAKCTQ